MAGSGEEDAVEARRRSDRFRRSRMVALTNFLALIFLEPKQKDIFCFGHMLNRDIKLEKNCKNVIIQFYALVK